MRSLPTDASSFAEFTNVSRETLGRLERYADLLIRWNKRINLVAPSTIPDLWARHMLDSMQIAHQIPTEARTLIDLGSGAGFPGLVLAALCPGLTVALAESDGRKCAFLREAAREMSISDRVEVIPRRIETLASEPPKQISLPVDIVTARGLSSLSTLLDYAQPLSGPKTVLLLLKGKRAQEELTAAKYVWHIDSEQIDSITDPVSCLIRIEGFSHVRSNSGEDSQSAP